MTLSAIFRQIFIAHARFQRNSTSGLKYDGRFRIIDVDALLVINFVTLRRNVSEICTKFDLQRSHRPPS